jgi:integrase
VRARVDQWEAASDISAGTAQRYRQLVQNQIAPHLGEQALAKVTRLEVEAWHTKLRNSGLAARTIGHAHRVLGKALKDRIVVGNVCKVQKVPKVADREMVIAQGIPGLLEDLRGWRLGVVGMVALFTGMRLGEVLALRWGERVDLDARTHQGPRGS